MPSPKQLHAAIDAATHRRHASEKERRHLGISIIGKPCERELVYAWRWAAKEQFESRMLRLFERGHAEEHVIAAWLRSTGATVILSKEVENDPEAFKHFRVSGVDGHYGGTCDAIAHGLPGAPDPDAWVLCELKTHNTKSFDKLEADGLLRSKFLHFIQAQVYAGSMGYPWILYFAVCKNDDRIFMEWIQTDPSYAAEYAVRAQRVVMATKLPKRISDKPGWHECMYCAAAGLCKGGEATLPRNCRTCNFATPEAGGVWSCRKERKEISGQKGCEAWLPSLMLTMG